MSELCTVQGCYSFGRYCRLHSKKSVTPAVAEPIKTLSKKREKLQRQYRKQVKEALAEDNRCEVRSPDCTGTASGFNHRQKRSEKNLINKKNLEICCSACQIYIEQHPEWAKANGHQISRFKTI